MRIIGCFRCGVKYNSEIWDDCPLCADRLKECENCGELFRKENKCPKCLSEDVK